MTSDNTFPTGPFNLILADPPWDYKCNTAWSAPDKNAYARMPLEQLCAMPIQTIAAEDCALFLWCTWPMIQSGLDVMKAWGFQYKTAFTVWIKISKKSGRPICGSGSVTRPNTEFVLYGTKGQITKYRHLTRNCWTTSQVLMTPRSSIHSRKPTEEHKRIVSVFGDLPRIELFARQRKQGWHTWGDQLSHFQPSDLWLDQNTYTTFVLRSAQQQYLAERLHEFARTMRFGKRKSYDIQTELLDLLRGQVGHVCIDRKIYGSGKQALPKAPPKVRPKARKNDSITIQLTSTTKSRARSRAKRGKRRLTIKF